jgi:hypothetical protein
MANSRTAFNALSREPEPNLQPPGHRPDKDMKGAKMKTKAEKRDCVRRNYPVPIVFSYFNKNACFDAQTLNHSTKGMCFKSSFSLCPGATLYIKVKNFHPYGHCTGICKGLHTAILAEVKRCEENLDRGKFSYNIGVKFYGPIY